MKGLPENELLAGIVTKPELVTALGEAALIYIADIHFDDLREAAQICKQAQYQVRLFQRADKLLQQALVRPPDILIIATHLSDADGYSLCQQLQGHEILGKIPCLFILEAEDWADKHRPFIVGCVDYLCKPLNADELRQRLAGQLALQRQQQAIPKGYVWANVDKLQKMFTQFNQQFNGFRRQCCHA